MTSKPITALTSVLCVIVCSVTVSAEARPPRSNAVKEKSPAADPPSVVKARELFMSGAKLVQGAQWAEALSAFEQSSILRPHPITTYNIGACERALGRYTVARARLERAIDGEPGSGATLPLSLQSEAKAYLAEIERILAHVDLSIAPADAAVAVDGRPLETVDAPGSRSLVAGLRAAGRGEVLPSARVELVLDPGTHLITLSRKGFSDQLVTKTFTPGSRQALVLNLDRLPSKLRIASNEPRALVHVDQMDVGYVPVEVERPSGVYSVSVEKRGFVSYETTVNVSPGEAADIKAALSPTPMTQKWWFWTAATILVSGAVVGTYYATRSEPSPQRPPLDGGGLKWSVQVP